MKNVYNSCVFENKHFSFFSFFIQFIRWFVVVLFGCDYSFTLTYEYVHNSLKSKTNSMKQKCMAFFSLIEVRTFLTLSL